MWLDVDECLASYWKYVTVSLLFCCLNSPKSKNSVRGLDGVNLYTLYS